MGYPAGAQVQDGLSLELEAVLLERLLDLVPPCLPLLVASLLGLSLPPVRDVPRHRGVARQIAVLVPDREDLKQDVNHLAVPADPARFERRRLAPKHHLSELVELLTAVVGNDQLLALADDLTRGVSVDALRGGIPGEDRSVEGVRDHRVLRREHHPREALALLLALLPFGDVPDDRGVGRGFAFGSRERHLDRDLDSVRAPSDPLEALADPLH